MSRTVHGVDPVPAKLLRPLRVPDLPTVPWITLTWATSMVVGVALLLGYRPDARPIALASPAPAPPPAVLEVEDQVRELAARVRVLEAEVRELRSPVVHVGRRVALED